MHRLDHRPGSGRPQPCTANRSPRRFFLASDHKKHNFAISRLRTECGQHPDTDSRSRRTTVISIEAAAMTDLNQTTFQKCTAMTVDKTEIDTLVVGAGQAGVAMSEHLSKLGVPHLVLERNRIAEAWRTGRWDSLVANGPAWHDRFPGLEFDDISPDGFAPKERVADYFEAYARKFKAPIRTGVEVKKVERNVGRPGFTIETSQGVIEASRVVAATGPFQRPVIPPIAPKD